MATNTIAKLFPLAAGNGDLTIAGTTALKAATSGGTVIKQIQLVNHGATSETVSLYIHTSNAFTSAHLFKKMVMAAGDTAEFNGTIVMNTTESLWATTTTAATVSCQVYGMDMT